MLRNRRIFMAGVIALALLGATTVAQADHSWSTYHIARTANPFTLKIVDSVTPDWQASFDQSLNEWSKSNVLDNVVASADDGSRTRKRCQAVSGQMRVCNAAYGQNGWLGLASINIDSNGHIVQGTAKMNDSYAWYFDANPGEDNHVMCQEIGHVYGLGHTSEDGSSQSTCMDYSSSLSSQWPNAHDYDQLSTIYSHLDSYNSYDDGGSSGGGGGCTAPPGKGCNKALAAAPAGVPADAIMIHYSRGHGDTLGHADWIKPSKDGSMWIYHATLVPEGEGHDGHDH